MAGRRREPEDLVRILTAAARLPPLDPLRLAAAARFDAVRAAAGDDTYAMANRLGTTPRSVQRLRVLYGCARPPGFAPRA